MDAVGVIRTKLETRLLQQDPVFFFSSFNALCHSSRAGMQYSGTSRRSGRVQRPPCGGQNFAISQPKYFRPLPAKDEDIEAFGLRRGRPIETSRRARVFGGAVHP
jgi:hypothetical protein